MPLPKNTIRVLPNPWGFIHHDLGPQARCHLDTNGRGGDPRFVGAEIAQEGVKRLTNYEATSNDNRLDEWVIPFHYPALNPLLDGAAEDVEDGIEFARTPYYLDRLRDGDLIPADTRTAELDCRFASLAEARAAGIANFEAHFGAGTFAELCPDLAKTTSTATLAVAELQTAPFASLAPADAETTAATPDAKSARASRVANGGQS